MKTICIILDIIFMLFMLNFVIVSDYVSLVFSMILLLLSTTATIFAYKV